MAATGQASLGGAQFDRAPQTRIVVATPGANPNAAAVFSMISPSIGEHLGEPDDRRA